MEKIDLTNPIARKQVEAFEVFYSAWYDKEKANDYFCGLESIDNCIYSHDEAEFVQFGFATVEDDLGFWLMTAIDELDTLKETEAK